MQIGVHFIFDTIILSIDHISTNGTVTATTFRRCVSGKTSAKYGCKDVFYTYQTADEQSYSNVVQGTNSYSPNTYIYEKDDSIPIIYSQKYPFISRMGKTFSVIDYFVSILYLIPIFVFYYLVYLLMTFIFKKSY